jgi:uncharacterized protein YdbL (DUF1318 family)
MTDQFNSRRAALAAILTAGLVVAASPAFAQDAKARVDAAKAAGQVGEQGDGFLGVVTTADAAVQGAVAEINAGRASAYRDIAAKTGVDAVAAGQATAVQLFARIPAGQYYKPLGGNWTRK